MADYFRRSILAGTAWALYISGFFVGIVGGCLMLVLGVIAIFKGTDLVNAIAIVAGISAVGLTIAETGRKILRSLPAANPRFGIIGAPKSVG